MDVMDHDGDGDLDLIVGGYSSFKPEGATKIDRVSYVWLYENTTGASNSR
jgi:hypothetical protein